MTSPTDWNYYEVLDVQASAPQSDIYDAYLKSKETYSITNPNIFNVFSEDEAHAWLEIIEEAYSIIGHPNTRRIYDQEIQQTDSSAQEPNERIHLQTIQETLEELPPGHKKTPISVYAFDPNIEAQIENQDIFDGLFLKKIRNYKNINLQDFSKHTCIAIRHLYAIENNNFSVLPAPVFVRGYIIQYCRLLDLPQNKVVNSFMSLLTNYE